MASNTQWIRLEHTNVDIMHDVWLELTVVSPGEVDIKLHDGTRQGSVLYQNDHDGQAFEALLQLLHPSR